jgi:hypothetical protein
LFVWKDAAIIAMMLAKIEENNSHEIHGGALIF